MEAPPRMENDSGLTADFVHENPGVAIPYLTLLTLAMVVGTVGNFLVICAVFLDKVRMGKACVSSSLKKTNLTAIYG